MKYIKTAGDKEFWELSKQEVENCINETRKNYPRIINLVFFKLAYEVHLAVDGSGLVTIPKGLIQHD